MSRVRGLAAFVYEFVIGDDPLIALAVVAALGLTAAVGAWWIVPAAVAGVLAASVARGAA